MKKILLLLSAFTLGTFATVQAQMTIVNEVEPAVTDLSSLTEGQQVAFYAFGESDRQGYLMETDYQALKINPTMPLGKTSSSDYVWTIESVNSFEGGVEVKLRTPRGNYMPNFTYQNAKPKYPGKTALSADSAATFSIVLSGVADSVVYIYDENNVYFNAQGPAYTGAICNFVGWPTSGGNSQYVIRPLKAETRSSFTTTLYLYTTGGDEIRQETIESTIGTEIAVPEVANHTFVSAENADDETPVTLPLRITEFPEAGELNLMLTYEKWPFVSIICRDSEGNILKTSDSYMKKGTVFNASTFDLGRMGYALLTEGYDECVITQDSTINLAYEKQPTAGLPFSVTTVSENGFADGTSFYTMRIRGGYAYVQNGTNEIKVSSTIEQSDSIDNYLWAFTGDIDRGFQIYNKGAGTSQLLYAATTANKTPITIGTPDDTLSASEGTATFNLAFNNASNAKGYAFSAATESTACFNRFGGATGTALCFWTNSKSPTDIGSRIVFSRVDEELANKYRFAISQQVLNSAGCVGSYTTEQLADLATAVANQDFEATVAARRALIEQKPIAFDSTKCYNLISAYRNFVINQPGKLFAVYANDADSLAWNELTDEAAASPSYAWRFKPTAEGAETFTIVNLARQRAIASYRYGQYAVLVAADHTSTAAEGTTDIGDAAAFTVKEAPDVVAPNSFYFIHTYGASFITMASDPVNSSTVTSGLISTLNYQEPGYNNAWFLRPCPDSITGITSPTLTTSSADEAIYDLQGRRIASPTRGLYIKGGKKVYIK